MPSEQSDLSVASVRIFAVVCFAWPCAQLLDPKDVKSKQRYKAAGWRWGASRDPGPVPARRLRDAALHTGADLVIWKRRNRLVAVGSLGRFFTR